MTIAQKLASDPKISAKVAANAGTGKTKVLTDRVLRLLLNHVHPSKILCLTYTKAAAAEMSERVVGELKKWVKQSDAELAATIHELTGDASPDLNFARQLFTSTLQSLPPPRIQTIHSFCQEVLRRFPLEAGVPPYFTIIDEPTAHELLEEARKKLLDETTGAIAYLTRDLAEKTFEDLMREIISNRNKFRNTQYLEPIEIDEYAWVGEEIKIVAAALCESANENDVKRGEKIKTAKTIEELFEIFFRQDGEMKAISSIATKKTNIDPVIIAQIQQQIGDIIDKQLYAKEVGFTNSVITAAYMLFGIYDKIKLSRNMLDYEDLIFYTRKLLSEASAASWVLYKLDSRIEHILVDEAQDTTPEQWEIITAIVDEFFAGRGANENERTVFIVGDEKQSIYSFQGADPRGFAAVSRNIGQKAVEAAKNWREIPLDVSFRSLSPVLEFVDKTFENNEIKRAVSTSEKPIRHEAFRQGQGGNVEVWDLIERKKSDEMQPWEMPVEASSLHNEKSELAEQIADRVAEWLKSGKIKDASEVMVLLRKRTQFADLIISKLKSQNIPVAGADRLQLASHLAIKDMIALCNFVLLPEDDLSLACVLKSPLFGVSEEELFKLCYGRTGSLWERVDNEELKTLIKIAAELPPFEFFSYVLDTMKGRQKFISRLGIGAIDPLDELLNLALDYECSNTASLQGFVEWFNKTAATIKRDMEKANGQLRVMTIHGSKGLQSKIVILPDTTSLPENNKSRLLWDENNLLGLPPGEFRSRRATTIKAINRQKEYEEYLRLLYVALTRAADELYICGAVGDSKLKEGSWYQILTANNSVKASEEAA